MREKLRVCLVVLVLVFTGSLLAQSAAADVTVNPTSVSFGSVNVNSTSAPSTLVLTNNGSHSVTLQRFYSTISQFVVSGPALPYTLASHQSVSFTVVFKPTAASSLSGRITFSFNRNSYFRTSVSVTGTGVAATATHVLSYSSTHLDFGNILVGNSSYINCIISNTGTGSVTVSQISAAGTGFTASGITLPVTLAPNQTATFGATFKPTAAGAATGTVTVGSNASNSPTTISLTGSGVQAQSQISVVPTSVSFGNVAVGVTNTQTVTVRNSGTAAISVSQANVTGTGFAKSGITLPLNLAAGASSAFTVSFTPASAATTAGTLTIVSNASNPSLSVMLSGTGTAQTRQLSPNPSSVNFGSVAVQTSKSQSVTLTNTGNASISVSQITVGGAGFSQSGLTMPLTLAAGQSTSFNAIFDPATSGALTGTATITSNATNSPTTIALSGSGTAAATHSVNLTWGASPSDVTGYYVYVGSQSGGPYTRLNSSPTTTTSYTDSSVVSGQTYYFVTTAVDSSGTESSYSNQAVAVIP